MKDKRGAKEYATIGLKGMAMGAADVVPGVSGGTIAFISGIYEELLYSIKSIDLAAIKLLFRGRFKEFWKKVNGNFLLILVTGIAISFFSLANLMTYLLETQPIAVWSFFFGLIIASTIIIGKDVNEWSIKNIAILLVGIGAGYAVTVITPGHTPETWWFIMLSGAVAICAMMLPGISGAFILLLMGKYHFLMGAVARVDIPIILIFIAGALIGIISFSHILTWLLNNYKNVTVAFLTGVMFGSLNKIWPWKITTSTYTDSHGVIHSLTEKNVLPKTYQALEGAHPEIGTAIIFLFVGLAVIFILEGVSRRIAEKQA